jgi:polyketide synthase PksN
MKPGQLDSARPLEAYGMDSILVVHLTNALRKHFENITSTLFFEVQTIDALVDHLLKHQKEAVIRNVGMAAAPAPPEAAAQPATPGPVAAPPSVSPPPAREQPARLAAPVPPPPASAEIAIVGLSVRFPQARDADEFWSNLKAGRNCITEIPKERWDWTLHYHEEAGRRGSYYSKWGGFVADADCFDPLCFQISPREAHRMDPQERIFLETAYACIEDAGYTPGTLSQSRRVGVFVGVMNSTYHPLPNYASVANRVSYQLDLQGPSLAVDTACSASLTAIHLAIESLASGTSECALAGGVNLNLSPLHYLRLSEARMLSPGPECKPFGNGADGMVDGEGVGAVLLKKLSQAIADGDHIYGVIKASAVNAGGKTNGYTVPNPVAQARLVADALDRGGIPPRTISYIEAHGTGTVLGDPIEITGLTRAFQEVSKQATPDLQFCAVGSIKSNIGHCESAAGIAGLAKILLQLKHGQLAPSLHAESTNPNIDFTRTPFFVQQKLQEWQRPVLLVQGVETTCPRRAGLSSFGAGGANAHLVVEEFLPPARPSSNETVGSESAAIVLSARTAESLAEVVGRLLKFLDEHPGVCLGDLAYTLQVGREAKEQRLGLAVRSVPELREKLTGWQRGETGIEGVYSGDSQAARETRSLFSADEELGEAVAKWISRRKIDRLVELWVKGLEVDWRGLHAAGQRARLSLPTYPFARERYWHVESSALPNGIPGPAIEPTPAAVPPLADHPAGSKAPRITLTPLSAASSAARSAVAERPVEMAAPAQAAAPDEDLEQQLAASLAEALLMKPGALDPEKSFVELGLDSIVGVEWIQTLNKAYGLRLSVTKLYDHPNLRQWTAFIRGQIRDQFRDQWRGRPVAEVPRALTPDVAAATQPLAPPAPAEQPGLLADLTGSLAAILMMAPADVTVSKSFVDLGLDSILGVEWIKALNQQYGLRLAVSAIYDHPNLEAFAAWLRPEVKPLVPPESRPESPRPIAPPVVELRIATDTRSRPTPATPGRIAIVGISGRYPQAEDLNQYWKNLAAGRHSVREIPPSRWDVSRYYHPDPSQPGTIYCKSLGMLEGVDCFDPLFFMISPDEAEGMDPQHRLFLEEGYRAMENAGYGLRNVGNQACGVYLGIMSNEYGTMLTERPEGRSLAGNSFAMAAARLAYFLNLKGPAIPVDTACSSSLVAAHLACQALLNREIDMAVVGGVSLYLRPEAYLGMCAAGMLAADGRCKPFDASADGFIPGEGVGGMVLKRLEEAEADGDIIHGVILGSAINQDGRTNGITAPSMTSQIDLVRNLYQRLDIDPQSIGYVEMHGTGTRLGDPIELEALAAVYRQATERRQFCAIGSVKSNIGHASAAAGIASLHKVLLCLKHQMLVPTLHFKKPNPHFDLEGSPFYVNTQCKPWDRVGGQPRRAAISSFGFSGTNAHLVIEEYLKRPASPLRPGKVIIPLSAKTPDALRLVANRLLAALRDETGNLPRPNLADVAGTLQLGRDAFEERAAFVAASWQELEVQLQAIAEGSPGGGNLNRGRVRGEKSAQPKGAADREVFQPHGEPLGQEQYEQVAALWAAGRDVDWHRLYPSGHRPAMVSLPGYPFARERYWAASPTEPGTGPKAASWLHPLLQGYAPDGNRRHFGAAFSGRESFLRDHLLNGEKVLSGSCCLEMVCAALDKVDSIRGRRIVFRQVAWLAPVMVGEAGCEVQVFLEPCPEESFGFEIRSRNPGEREPAVRARGVVMAGVAKPGPGMDLRELRTLTGGKEFNRTQCYAAFAGMGVQYGPMFQAVDGLRCGSGHVLAQIIRPEPDETVDRPFILHPGILDGAWQAAIGFALAAGDNGSTDHHRTSPPLRVPFAIEEMEIFSTQADRMWAWVRSSPGGSLNQSVSKLDIDLGDEQGRICVRIQGYSSRTMPGGEAVSGVGLWRPEWRPAAASTQAAQLEGCTREVILHQMPPAELGRMEGAVSRIDLEGNGDTEDRQIIAVLADLLQRIQRLADDARGRQAILQVLARTEGQGWLLSCLPGLFKTVALEHPNVHCQFIELGGGAAGTEVAQILNENAAAWGDVHVRYEGRQRLLPAWAVVEVEEEKIPWRDGGVYLLTGGAGALGLIFAREIAGRCQVPRIILVGRSALAPEPAAAIQAIARQGAIIEYRQLDVGDAAAVENLVQDIRTRFGGLHGILHGAGITRDRLLANKTEADFQAVLAPKIAGALILDRVTRALDLDFFVLFSSTGGVTGNMGQADYCAANAFLDAFARKRNQSVASGQRGGRTLAIDWPLWRDGGLQVDQATEAAIRLQTGMVPMASEAGIRLFYRSLATGESQVLVMQGNQGQFSRFLAGLSSRSAAASGAAPETAADEGTELNLPGAIDYFTEVVASALKLAANRIDPDEGLDQYGFDSIKGLQVIRDLEQIFGPLPKTVFFECQTVRGVAGFFLASHPETMRRLLRKPAAQLPPLVNPAAGGESAIQPPPGENRCGPLAARADAPATSGALDIAIIGLAGRYPQARSLAEYWCNLREGKDCVTTIPPDRWDWRSYYSADKSVPGTYYSNRGGFIPEADRFDAQFFNISPREAEYIDPQERLFLEHAWMAMEDAGYAPPDPRARAVAAPAPRVGVYVGVMYSEFQLLGGQATGAEKGMALGGSFASIANRVSYFLDLHGPSLSIDTMCSSSLTCLHLACQDLKHGHTDLAIAGGVNLSLHPNKYLLLSGGQFLSEKGRCDSFGAGADGYIPGEGVGVAILKRLADAERDGDFIYGVIKGSAINHGGRSSGYSVPNPNAQGEVVARAIQEAGLHPEGISYVEAHGTGTSLGDPIEIAGLVKAFGRPPGAKPVCWLGSAKSNIGHCESAAGIAGLTKVLLQMKNRQIVPSLHAEVANPNIDFSATPFVLNRELRAWDQPIIGGQRFLRTAGVSSFGAGGSNAHMVVQEYDGPAARRRPPEENRACLIVLSARNEQRLQQKISELHEYLRSHPGIRLDDLAYTLQVGRKAMEQRLAFAADSVLDVENKLQAIRDQRDLEGVHRGEVKYRKQAPAAQLGEVQPGHLEALVRQGNLARLAELWVQGVVLDWSLGYRDRRAYRIPLPAYPFARSRFWLGPTAAEVAVEKSLTLPAGRGNGNGNGNGAGEDGESFHSELLDQLLAGEINADDAIRQIRERDHGD